MGNTLLTNDRIIQLLQKLEQELAIIEKYYPKNRIKPATEFFIQEIFENDNN